LSGSGTGTGLNLRPDGRDPGPENEYLCGCDVIASLPGGVLEEAEEFGEAAVEGKSLDTEATTAGNDVGGPERTVEHRSLIFGMGLTCPIPQARFVGELLEAPPVRLAERLRAGAAIEWMPAGEITVE